MNESIRTITFVGAAALIGVVAWISHRASVPQPPPAASAELIEPFDVADASSFKIERYDSDEQKLVKFEVSRQGGRWVIPSHDNYPADAQAQLQKVASFFTGMKTVGSVQSEDPKQHGAFGLLQPDADSSGDGKQYGSVVTITDASGSELVNLIVGKSAKAEGGSDNLSSSPLRFVREVGHDQVYVVEISSDAITTKFEDWIEQDLLKLNSFDVAKLDLQDYSILPARVGNQVRMAFVPRMDTVVDWNATSSQWELQNMFQYSNGKRVAMELAEDEELDKSKLDGVKTAVDDLKIVDVERKPKVLFEALKSEDIARDEQAIGELQEFGIYVLNDEETQKLKLVGSNGGLSVSMKDGVKYNLYFGDPKSAEKGDSSKLNRYLMVMAEVDESMIPKPKLEPEDEPLGPDATNKSEGDAAGESKPEDSKPEDSKPEDSKPEDSKPEDNDETSEKADEAALKGQDLTEESDGEAKSDDEKQPEDDAEKKRRETVKKENKRKMDEYHDKLKKAQDRVAELNARFNDWFYVVSDDVYKKVQLGRADIVKDRASAKEEGFGVDAFRQLQQGGVKNEKPATSAAPPPPPGGLPSFPGGDE